MTGSRAINNMSYRSPGANDRRAFYEALQLLGGSRQRGNISVYLTDPPFCISTSILFHSINPRGILIAVDDLVRTEVAAMHRLDRIVKCLDAILIQAS